MDEVVSVFVYVCECPGGWGVGHSSMEGPSGLALQSNEPFQKKEGETPSTTIPDTQTHTQKITTWYDDMTASARRGRVLRLVLVLDNHVLAALENRFNRKWHTRKQMQNDSWANPLGPHHSFTRTTQHDCLWRSKSVFYVCSMKTATLKNICFRSKSPLTCPHP